MAETKKGEAPTASKRGLIKRRENINEVMTMNIVSNLLAFITKNRVRTSRNHTFHKVG